MRTPRSAPALAGGELYVRDAAYRREGLAAEAERAYGLQPALVLQLAGRVAEEGYAASSGDMPQPSSVTRMNSRPPPRSSTVTFRAPASTAFSSSSFTTEAGPFHNLAGGDEVRHKGGEYVYPGQWGHLLSALLLFGILYSKSVELSTAK